jgi:hypothetical protein
VRCHVDAPSVLETSKCTLFVLCIPLLVIRVTGNHTANAIKNTFAECVVGNVLRASGIHAVVGIGPISLVTGFSQYATFLLYPSANPVRKPTDAPHKNPVINNLREEKRFSRRNILCSKSKPIILSNDGKYNVGRRVVFVVIRFKIMKNTIVPVRSGAL